MNIARQSIQYEYEERSPVSKVAPGYRSPLQFVVQKFKSGISVKLFDRPTKSPTEIERDREYAYGNRD